MMNHTDLPAAADEDERQFLEALADQLDQGGREIKLVTSDGREFDLPRAIVETIATSSRAMSKGEAAVVLPLSTEVSPQQAGRILSVSRPYVARLLDQGKIPFHRVGSHRRILLSDLLAYKEQRDASRREELRRLSELSREMGIPE